jgi:alpha-N-acetylglucosaminidase
MKAKIKTRIWIFLLPFLFLSISGIRSTNCTTGPDVYAEALIARVLPGHHEMFITEIIPSEEGKDVFEIEASADKKIILRGNNPLSVAMAFNWYLRYYAHLSYDWQATGPLSAIGHLPLPERKIHQVCLAKERFFNNTCTFGYTYPFWNWQQWERLIDWMAMNGINRPLMLAGQEAVWLKVWQSFGMKEDEVCAYFSGPAHLPWHRMANMDKWGGPLPISYIEGQMKLQQHLLERLRQLGMKPILPAFSGHVPPQLKPLRPDARITRIDPGWGGMEGEYTTWFLDPGDPMFFEIQEKYLLEQNLLYGTDHLYSADPFNEITPPSWEPEYLASIGKTIYQTMAAADKDAVWYQMAWTFLYDIRWTAPRLSAMIKAVPVGKMVLLDYACEQSEYFRRSDNFYGASFIWCYLGNFGGNTQIVAPLSKISKRLENALPVENCLGVGSTLEGINVNPEIYELTFEVPWMRNAHAELSQWMKDYAIRRTGIEDSSVISAWKLMAKKVLVDSGVGIWTHGVIYQVIPSVDMNKNRMVNYSIPYKNADLATVLEKMLQASPESKKSDNYRFDVVNITRQLLGNYGTVLHKKMMEAYRNQNLADFRDYADQFIRMGHEIDTLLGTRHEFLLGRWIRDARSWGKGPAEKDYYEKNARQIITTWHKADKGLTDYANRQWNGLFGTYYLPRWQDFINRLDKSLSEGHPVNLDEAAKWRGDFETTWVEELSSRFIEVPKGSPVKYAGYLFRKYRGAIMN